MNTIKFSSVVHSNGIVTIQLRFNGGTKPESTWAYNPRNTTHEEIKQVMRNMKFHFLRKHGILCNE